MQAQIYSKADLSVFSQSNEALLNQDGMYFLYKRKRKCFPSISSPVLAIARFGLSGEKTCHSERARLYYNNIGIKVAS